MHKRGISQIDWIISLALFLLYIAWFFIFIRPLSIEKEAPNIVELVAEKFQQDAYWSVLNYPIIIKSNFSIEKEPIVVDSGFSNQSNLFMINKSFFLISEKLFFLNNISPGTTIAYILNSNENYDVYNEITDLVANNESASASGLYVDIQNNTIISADFKGKKIFLYSLESNGKLLSPSNLSFSNRGIAALYPIITQKINVTTMIFAYNPRIYMMFAGNSSISESFDIYKYENYYLNSEKKGSVAVGSCYYENSEIAEFYTGNSVMLFILSKPAEISFCGMNESISLNIAFNVSRDMMQKIIFYDGSPDDFIKYKYAYSAKLGIPEKTTALSLFNLKLLNVTNYNILKNKWNVGDFRVDVFNITNGEKIVGFGGIPYDKATVYAKESRNFLLDKFGKLEDVRISIQSWT